MLDPEIQEGGRLHAAAVRPTLSPYNGIVFRRCLAVDMERLEKAMSLCQIQTIDLGGLHELDVAGFE